MFDCCAANRDRTAMRADDGDRVEIAWRKSSFSGNDSNCVEVARREGAVSCGERLAPALRGSVAAIRDSKSPSAGTLAVPFPAFTYLVTTIR